MRLRRFQPSTQRLSAFNLLPSMRLKIFSILLGFFLGMLAFMVCHMVNSIQHPFPEGVDMQNRDAVREAISKQPDRYFVFIVISRAFAVFVAAFVACFLRGKAWLAAAVIPAVMFLFLALLAHNFGGYPDWFPMTELAVLLPAGFLAYLVAWYFLGNEFALANESAAEPESVSVEPDDSENTAKAADSSAS